MTRLFVFPEQEALGRSLVAAGGFAEGKWEWRHFPDGESHVRVVSDVKGEEVVILCSLNQPDAKTLPLVFLVRTLKELGAAKVTLVAPYLGYMRQDTRFQEGDAVTAPIFAALLSPHIDALVTVDPHLHRIARLEDIYECPCTVLSAAPLMAEWIGAHVARPLIIGPDMESEQWVADVARTVDAPYVILHKTRKGDREVEIILPDMAAHKDRMPVLVDDIISTAGTMIKTVTLLRGQGFPQVACLATHALFAGDAYVQLQAAGAGPIVTANTVVHPSNGMDVGGVFFLHG